MNIDGDVAMSNTSDRIYKFKQTIPLAFAGSYNKFKMWNYATTIDRHHNHISNYCFIVLPQIVMKRNQWMV